MDISHVNTVTAQSFVFPFPFIFPGFYIGLKFNIFITNYAAHLDVEGLNLQLPEDRYEILNYYLWIISVR